MRPTEGFRVVRGDCEWLSSVQSSFSSSSSPTSKLACPFTGPSSSPFLRRLFFVCAFSPLDWFPNLVDEIFRPMDTSDLFFFIETLDPTRGKLTLELLRLKFWVVGLAVGVCDADLLWCLVCATPSAGSPGPNLESLCRPLPCDGTLPYG